MVERVDAVVVGAGVIGLAVARRLALSGREVLVLERNGLVGSETSARNSEVIHAGIYNPPGSLKSTLCVAGRRALYGYCAERGVPHAKIGKLIVAVEEADLATLARLKAQAETNGVENLRLLDAAEAQRLEPALRCVGAMHSPETGIIDGHGLLQGLEGDLAAAGGTVVLNAPVESASLSESGIRIAVGGAEPTQLDARILVNAAGLGAADLACATEGLPERHAPEVWYAKGNYFGLAANAPFSRLIYPTPVPGGLGTHMTLDLAGRARFGPDVEWVERIDYAVDPARAAGFYADIRRYWPDLPDGALQPDYAGIRPKLAPPIHSKPGTPNLDFRIEGPQHHGVPGLVNLFGIESPGLTACLAIADHVAELLT
jgi:L-2-hydroxyglutarate oxidase LhgO